MYASALNGGEVYFLGYDPAGERRAGSSQINLLDLWKVIQMSAQLLALSTLSLALRPSGLSWNVVDLR